MQPIATYKMPPCRFAIGQTVEFHGQRLTVQRIALEGPRGPSPARYRILAGVPGYTVEADQIEFATVENKQSK